MFVLDLVFDLFRHWTWLEILGLAVIGGAVIACWLSYRKALTRVQHDAHRTHQLEGRFGTYLIGAGVFIYFYVRTAGTGQHPLLELFFYSIFLAFTVWFGFRVAQDLLDPYRD